MRKAALCLVVLSACARAASAPPTTAVHIAIARGTLVIHAEIADTEAERERGLMGRRTLASDHGMIFVWTDLASRDFYMKDTLIPLDLISISEGRVVGITTMTPCPRDPCEITKTPPADSALEVPAGTAERAGISAGALVQYSLP